MSNKLSFEELVRVLSPLYCNVTIMTVLALALFMFLLQYIGFILHPLTSF